MAVPQRRTSSARRNQRRGHDKLKSSTLSTDQTTGEIHRRHHLTPDGFYRGRKVLENKE